MQHGQQRELLLLGASLVVACLGIGVLVTQLGAPHIDLWLVEHADQYRDGIAGAVFGMASELGYAGPMSIIVAVGAVLIGILTKSWRSVALVAAATPIALLAVATLKRLFDRPRPGVDPVELLVSYSMPSGHASCTAAFAASIVLALPVGRWRWSLGSLGIAFAVVTGVSRVTRGMHYPTDVLAGWCLGAGVACLVAAALAQPRGEQLAR